jgi:hypothetical protein
MLTFLSPLFLFGLAAAVIPLVIHLSRSRRTKKMRFSTTRFFTDQFLRSYRMSRLKELLLLACRMALFALFAVALARPLLLPRGQPFLGNQARRAVVLILDDSASMGYREDGRPLLDHARDVAREILVGLGPNDSASVVLAGRRAAGPEALFPQPTSELADVLQALESVKVSSLGTDLRGAFARAEAVVRSSNAESKEIYVLSDLQASGWESPCEDQTSGDSEVLWFFVSVQPHQPNNVAITAVQYAAARPMVGVPFALLPHLRVQGEGIEACEVRLYVDGQKVGERRVERLQSGRWAVPHFYHTFATGGWHYGYFEVSDDPLLADNRRYFALEVLATIKVLAVNGAPSQVPRLDELFFLKAALTAGAEGTRPIQLDVTDPVAIGGTDLIGYPLVILANVATLPDPVIEKLEGYVDHGGNLLVFLGDKVDRSFYNQTLAGAARLHGGLLPGQLLALEGDPGKETNPVYVGEMDFKHPAFAAFQDSPFSSPAAVTFKALWKVDPGPATVPMRASTGSPLLCEKPFGNGRVILFTSTCDRDWTNFPVRPAFLPWVYRLIGYLAQQPLGRQSFFLTGDRVPLPFSRDQALTVRRPDNSLAYAKVSADGAGGLEFTDSMQPGVYTVYTSDKKEAAQQFVANLEGRESDLTYQDQELARRDDLPGRSPEERIAAGLKEMLPGRPQLYYIADPARATEVAQTVHRGFGLWDYLLAVVLAVALFEPWFANRINSRHYSSPDLKPELAAPRAGRWTRLLDRRDAAAAIREGGAP